MQHLSTAHPIRFYPICLAILLNSWKVYFLEFLYLWSQTPFCKSLLPLLSSKTSIKFIISFPSACFILLMISARSLSILFPSAPHRLGLLFIYISFFPITFTRFKIYLYTSQRAHHFFLPDYSFYLILPTLPLSPYIVNIFWTACKGITHFHDIVISTYLKVQAYHMLIAQSSLLQF